jgi:hypothetical protein
MNARHREEKRKRINLELKRKRERNYKRYREFLILVLKHKGECGAAYAEYRQRNRDSVLLCRECPLNSVLCDSKGSIPKGQSIDAPRKLQKAKDWLEHHEVTKEIIVEILL